MIFECGDIKPPLETRSFAATAVHDPPALLSRIDASPGPDLKRLVLSCTAQWFPHGARFVFEGEVGSCNLRQHG